MTRIQQFGWRGDPEPGVGRVVSAHGDYYHLVCDEAAGEILARKKKSAFLRVKDAPPPLTPMTGDFVRFRYNSCGDSLITEVLPRFSRFERRDPAARRASQTLAVNFDVIFLMMAMNENFSIPRLSRYLALAEDIGEAEAVVVLTKGDLAGDGKDEMLRTANEISNGACACISSLTGEGLDSISRHFAPGRTVAFVGSSGVGKSTLLNVLAGEEWAATCEIQEWSGKGRHTTTSRELMMLPCGAMVVDTPGVKEIGIVGESESRRSKRM